MMRRRVRTLLADMMKALKGVSKHRVAIYKTLGMPYALYIYRAEGGPT